MSRRTRFLDHAGRSGPAPPAGRRVDDGRYHVWNDHGLFVAWVAEQLALHAPTRRSPTAAIDVAIHLHDATSITDGRRRSWVEPTPRQLTDAIDAVVNRAESGTVHLLDGSPWTTTTPQGVCGSTAGANDDQISVDSTHVTCRRCAAQAIPEARSLAASRRLAKRAAHRGTEGGSRPDGHWTSDGFRIASQPFGLMERAAVGLGSS